MKQTLVLKTNRWHFVRWLENRTCNRYESPSVDGEFFSFGSVEYVRPRAIISPTRFRPTVVDGKPMLGGATLRQSIVFEIVPLNNGCIKVMAECTAEHKPIATYFADMLGYAT